MFYNRNLDPYRKLQAKNQHYVKVACRDLICYIPQQLKGTYLYLYL